MSGAQFPHQPQSEQQPYSYTKVPNWILENGHLFDGNTLKIVNFMTRFTIGFHRQSHHFAVSYLALKLNLTKPTVIRAIDSLIVKGAITCLGYRGQTRVFQVNLQNPFPKVVAKDKERGCGSTTPTNRSPELPFPIRQPGEQSDISTKLAKVSQSGANKLNVLPAKPHNRKTIPAHKQANSLPTKVSKKRYNQRPAIKAQKDKDEFLTIRGKDFLPLAVKVFYPFKEIILNKLEKIKAAYAASIFSTTSASLTTKAASALKTKRAKNAAGRETRNQARRAKRLNFRRRDTKVSITSMAAKSEVAPTEVRSQGWRIKGSETKTRRIIADLAKVNAKTGNSQAAAALSAQKDMAYGQGPMNHPSQATAENIRYIQSAKAAKANEQTAITLTENGRAILNAWKDFVINIGKKPTTGQCIGYITKANDLAASGYTAEDVVRTLEKIQKLHPDRLTLGWIPNFYQAAKPAQAIAVEKPPKSDSEVEAESRQSWRQIIADWKKSGQWEKFEPYRQDEMLIYAGLIQPYQKRNIPPR